MRKFVMKGCVAALVCTLAGAALYAQPGILQGQVQPAGGRIPILIELAQEPGALAFAGVLERAGARTPQTVAAAAGAAQTQMALVEAEQQAVAATLAATGAGADEMFRVRRAMNGIAATVNASSLEAIRRIPASRRSMSWSSNIR